MNITDKIKLTNEDNMALMGRYPDNYFDLAIVDPEYGIGADKPSKKPNTVKQKNGSIVKIKQSKYIHKDWDSKPAGIEYFKEIKRVSKDQIIWGVNYYDFDLRGGRIVWDKLNGSSDQFDCEIAYNSLNNRTDIVRFMWAGMMQGLIASGDINAASMQQGDKRLNEKRIHPTQKPVSLYKWIFEKYGKPDFKYLDTHFGSGSIGIAFDEMLNVWDLAGHDISNAELIACELDKDYFDATVKRLNNKFGNEFTFDDAPENQMNIFQQIKTA